jgi:hypothetical protein
LIPNVYRNKIHIKDENTRHGGRKVTTRDNGFCIALPLDFSTNQYLDENTYSRIFFFERGIKYD